MSVILQKKDQQACASVALQIEVRRGWNMIQQQGPALSSGSFESWPGSSESYPAMLLGTLNCLGLPLLKLLAVAESHFNARLNSSSCLP